MATRRERVVVDLEDNLSAGVLREAAAVAVLNRELKSLSGQATGTKRSVDPLGRETMPITARNTDNASKSIDKFSGRLSLLVSGLTAVGPAAVPIGAVAIPAVSTLASGLGFLAVGAGSTILAFHGLGDALTKFNKAAADPTATSIEAAQKAMDQIAPSAQQFVLELHKIGPELTRIQQAAGADMFPGLTAGIRQAQDALPAVERIFRRVGGEVGNLSRDAGKSLGSKEWEPFLKFIGDEAPQALGQMGHALGSVTHGLAELWMATQPLNTGGLDWIERAAKGFDQWATGLDKTQGFQDFVAYVQQHGPEVEQLLSDTASLFKDVVEAAAPLGGPTLQALDLIVNLLDAIANSPLGTPILLLLQVNSVLKLTSAGLKAVGVDAKIGFGGVTSTAKSSTAAVSGLRAEVMSASEALRTMGGNARRYTSSGVLLTQGVSKQGLASLAKGAALAGGMAVAMSGADQAMGLTNTTSLALAGSLAGPLGTAVGGAVGLGLDWQASLKAEKDHIDALNRSVSEFASQGDIAGLGKMAADFEKLQTFVDSKGSGSVFANAGVGDQTAIPIDAFDKLSESISRFNTGLTGQSGAVTSLGDLQALANRMQPEMSQLGITFDDMLQMNPTELGKTVDNLVHMTIVADSASGRTHAVASAFADLSNEALSAEDRVQNLEDALNNLFGPKLNLNAARNSYLESLRGLNEALSNPADAASARASVHSAEITYRNAVKANGKDSAEAKVAAERLQIAQKKLAEATAQTSKAILGTSDAALKNQDAIRGIVSQMLGYIDAQIEAGKPAKEIIATYREQRKALIDTATQLGINKHNLEIYLKQLGFTPKAISTQVLLKGTEAAERNLQHLTRDRVIHITPRVDHLGTQDTTATGGHVLTGHADGGTVGGAPRAPYGDKVLIKAAPGEEIISNRHGQADRFRADRASGRIPGYADGGTVDTRWATRPQSRTSAAGASPAIDYGRLAQALSGMRPLYGDVLMQPHNYNQFRREMDQDRAMASLSSARHD